MTLMPIDFSYRKNPFLTFFTLEPYSRAILNESIVEFIAAFIEVSCALYAFKVGHAVRGATSTHHILGRIRFFQRHAIEIFADPIN